MDLSSQSLSSTSPAKYYLLVIAALCSRWIESTPHCLCGHDMALRVTRRDPRRMVSRFGGRRSFNLSIIGVEYDHSLVITGKDRGEDYVLLIFLHNATFTKSDPFHSLPLAASLPMSTCFPHLTVFLLSFLTLQSETQKHSRSKENTARTI